MGGGGRVLTALERNAQYLEGYVNFIKVFKHIDFARGEVEINIPKLEFGTPASYLRNKIIRLDLVQNNKKILLNLEKILFETNETEEILTYFRSNRRRFISLHSEFLNGKSNPEFLGKEVWEIFERTISNNARESFDYAELTCERFELGEPAISTDAVLSLEYAKNIVKGRFELGENSISKSNKHLLEYAEIIGPLPKHLYNTMVSNCIATE